MGWVWKGGMGFGLEMDMDILNRIDFHRSFLR